jgi:negative modulator of initiation of replication
MKTIEVDEELYRFIAGQTQHIGESASDILRRLLKVEQARIAKEAAPTFTAQPEAKGIVVGKEAGLETKLDRVKTVRELLISDEFASLTKVIDKFMLMLKTLYSIDAEAFAEATAVKGRKRVYFADNKELLLASGNTTKPRAIDGSPFWVITNTNTNRKRQMIEQLMERMAFPTELIEKVAKAI